MTFIQVAALTHLSTSATINTGADGWTGNLVSLTTTIAGNWVFIARASAAGAGAGARITNSAGTPIGNNNGYFWHVDAAGAINGSPVAGDFYQANLASGAVVYAQAVTSSLGTGTLFLDAYFIPTPGATH